MSLLVVSKVKETALVLAAERLMINDKPKFTRVSKTFIDRMEREFRETLKRAIHNHPTTGSTLR